MNRFCDTGLEFIQSGGLHLKYETLKINPQKIVWAEKSGDLGSQFKS
jgi:hypothetical protein